MTDFRMGRANLLRFVRRILLPVTVFSVAALGYASANDPTSDTAPLHGSSTSWIEGTLKVLGSMPVLNLLIILAAGLIVVAAAGRVPWVGSVDAGGRAISGTTGIAVLTVAFILALRIGADQSKPADLTPASKGAAASGGTLVPSPISNATPSQVAPKSQTPTLTLSSPPLMRVILSPPVYVDWGCEEGKTATVTLQLPPGVKVVESEVVITDLSNAASFLREQPSVDTASGIVTGQAQFHGLPKVFFNCPGGGHARVALRVSITEP